MGEWAWDFRRDDDKLTVFKRGSGPLPRLLAPTLPELWAFLAVALPVVAALAAPMSAVDLAYGVRAGQLMLASGSVLRTDPFTFTMGGQPWLDQQWLAQILFAVLHGAGGWALIALARAALVGVLYSLIFYSCRYVGVGLRTAAALTLAAFVIGAPSLAMRPQLLGEVLFALTLLLVLVRARHPRVLWLIPFVVAVWSNVHGTFFLGIGLLVVAVLSDALTARRIWRAEAIALVLAVFATGLTPWTFGVWPYAFSLGTSPIVRSLAAEWQVTSPLGFPGAPFFSSILATAVLGVRLARRRSVPTANGWPWAVFLAALAALGAYAERGIAWWAIAAPAAAAWLVDPATSHALVARNGRPGLNAVMAALVILIGVALLLPWRPLTDDSGRPLPLLSDAPARLSASVSARTSPGDRIFVPQAWASWFEYDVPGVLVPIDSRFELYSTEDVVRYLTVQNGTDGAPAALQDWDVTVVAESSGSVMLANRLASSTHWSQVSGGDDSWVYVRR